MIDDDPANAMRLARRLAAKSLGVDELPDDAVVEMSLDAEGNLRVLGTVIVPGIVDSIETTVRVAPGGSEEP